ncbi:MAG TPA: O-antigen ligase family protein [Sphingomicrobium sp.]
MASRARQAVGPAYLLLCLILGGSAQGIFFNLLLQLIGLAIIAWAAAAPADQQMSRPASLLFLLVIGALLLVALQLVPLPASLWSRLGARGAIADGYRVLGIPVPSLPVSLAPYATLATIVTVIPAVAMLCAILRLQAYRRSWLALALLAGTFAGILLGALQVASGDPQTSPWYLYGFSNFGFAVGFFANANHMAVLLVIALPFLAALLASARGGSVQRYSAAVALAAGAALVIVVGIALNRSLAGYGLAVPAVAASLLILLPARSPARLWIAIGSAVLLIAAVVALALSPIGERTLGTSSSVQSREAINATTARAIVDFLPLGSGLGTFKPVYKLYEDHDGIVATVINHAHNDYAELALEMGIPGIILMLLFLGWWTVTVWRAWRFADAGPYARAASIASAALLAHSLVDFPLRTAALSTCFAMCLGLLAERRTPPAAQPSELWPTRHVVLE